MTHRSDDALNLLDDLVLDSDIFEDGFDHEIRIGNVRVLRCGNQIRQESDIHIFFCNHF